MFQGIAALGDFRMNILVNSQASYICHKMDQELTLLHVFIVFLTLGNNVNNEY